MGFEDIGKRMEKRGPRSPAFLLALVGLVLIGLNFVLNEVARERADFGEHPSPTYWTAGIGVVLLLGAVVAKRYPNIATRIAFAMGGFSLIGLNLLLDDILRTSAERNGQSMYWITRLPAAIGCMMIIASVTALGRDLHSRSKAPSDPKS